MSSLSSAIVRDVRRIGVSRASTLGVEVSCLGKGVDYYNGLGGSPAQRGSNNPVTPRNRASVTALVTVPSQPRHSGQPAALGEQRVT